MQDVVALAPDRLHASGRRGTWCLWPLLLLVAAAHVPSLFHPFFIDDYVYLDKVRNFDWQTALRIVTSPTMDESASGVWWVPMGTLPFYRPIGQLTFALDSAMWGMNPFGFHLTNLLLHLACTAMAWRLALRLFGVPAYALATAVVFALHPVHGEAVMWISGRFDLLVCACVLASVLSYLKWRDSGSWLWAGLSVLWFAVGLGCKETALILPIVLAGIEAMGMARDAREAGDDAAQGLDDAEHRGPDTRQRAWQHTTPSTSGVGRHLGIFAAFGIVASLYVAGRIALFGSFTGKLPPPYGLDTSHPWSALQSLALNLSVYVLDLGLCAHVDLVYLSQIWREHPVLFGAGVVAASGILLAAVVVGRSRAGWFGVAWLAVFTAPSLLSMPGERNVYLASVGLALLAGAVYRALDGNRGGNGTEPFPRPPRPWLWPASYAVVSLFLVICVVQQVLMGWLTGTGEKVYRDLEALLPNPPPGARIYVVNQGPLNSVGFSQALRLRYGRPDLSGVALTVSPTLSASATDRVFGLGSDSIRVVREGGVFFSSFVERFHRFGDPVSTLPEAAQRAGLDLLNPPTSYDNLTVLEFRLPHPLNDPRVHVFYWDNQRVRGWLDLFRIENLAQLQPCRLMEAEASGTSQAPAAGL